MHAAEHSMCTADMLVAPLQQHSYDNVSIDRRHEVTCLYMHDHTAFHIRKQVIGCLDIKPTIDVAMTHPTNHTLCWLRTSTRCCTAFTLPCFAC